MLPLNTASRSRKFHFTIFLARVSGQIGPGSRAPCRVVAPPLADALADLLGIKADQLHERLVTEQQAGQRMDALNPKEGLQPIEQEVLHDRHHLALNRRALDAFHQADAPQLLHEVEEVIQQGPLVQSVHPLDHLLPVQPPCYP